MRFAIAISPSRESSSTEPISRRYIRTGSSVRSVGSLASDLAGVFGVTSTSSPDSLSSSSGSSRASASSSAFGFLGLYDVNSHLTHHRQHVFDLLGGDFLRRHHCIELPIGDVAALLGLLDHLLDGGVRQIEQRQRGVGGLGRLFFRRLSFFLRDGLDLRRDLGRDRLCARALSCHVYLHQRLSLPTRGFAHSPRYRCPLPYGHAPRRVDGLPRSEANA